MSDYTNLYGEIFKLKIGLEKDRGKIKRGKDQVRVITQPVNRRGEEKFTYTKEERVRGS